MIIDESKLHSIWYENSNGDKWVPLNSFSDIEPDGYVYLVSESPTTLNRNYFKNVQKDEVENCDHLDEHIKQTFGWMEGLEGRECKKCKGTQVKNIKESWSNNWRSKGSKKIMSGNSSWPQDLVIALVRPSFKERIKSILRGYGWNKTYEMSKAILIAANSCERCVNSLSYRYGLSWGYKEHSSGWDKSGTTCDFCSS